MDDDILAVASQQTLSLFITEGENFCLDEGRSTLIQTILCIICISEHLVLEQVAVVCCLALVTCMNVIG